MKLFKYVGHIAALLALLAAGSAMAQQALVAGRDYTQISPAQPTDSGKKIEIIEFFWYGCPHCYHLEPSLKAWLKRKPADVEFKPMPATFGAPTWEPLTRTYYALDAMSLAAKHHDALFAAIHEEKDPNKQRAMVNDSRIIADWLATKGVDKQKFLDAYNSFAVNILALGERDRRRRRPGPRARRSCDARTDPAPSRRSRNRDASGTSRSRAPCRRASRARRGRRPTSRG